MLLLQSILVYSLFAFLLWTFSKSVSPLHAGYAVNKGGVKGIPKQYWWCIIVFTIVSGIRWDVGVDHTSYVSDYIDMCNGSFVVREWGMELGFLYVSKVFAELGLHYVFYMAFWAFLQIYFVIYAYKENKEVVPYILILIVLGGYYFSWMNGIRQNVVACFFLFFSQYIQKKKLWKYLLCVALGYLIHSSAVILVPIFFLVYDKYVWNRTWVTISIFITCIIIGQTPMFVSQINNLDVLLSFIGYDYYSDLMDKFTDVSNFRSFNIGPRMIVNLVTYFICILCYKQASKYYNSPYFDLVFKLYFIGVCWYCLFVNTLGIFLRPNYYFIIFALPMTAYTLNYLCKMRRSLLYIVLLVTSLSFNYLSCYSDYKETDLTERRSQLYQFCFEHLDGK